MAQSTIERAFADIEFLQRSVDLDRKQPEKRKSFAQYRKGVVSQTRIRKGRELYRKHYSLLKEVERQYGVAPQYIVALWGIETNFGGYTGGFSVISALATMGYEGRREDFFKSELIEALRIIDQGHITPRAMKGSWAGAMGQNQFMPSSFQRFAVDHNGDGKRDLWGCLMSLPHPQTILCKMAGKRGSAGAGPSNCHAAFVMIG